MTEFKEIGYIEIKEIHEETHIDWTICNFLAVIKDESTNAFQSPKVIFQLDSWTVAIRPYRPMYPEVIQLYLRNSKVREYSIQYNFCWRYRDGSVKPLGTDVMEGTKLYGIPLLIRQTSIFQGNPAMASSDAHIICILKRINNSTQLSTMDKCKFKTLIELDTLSENLKNLYANKESCDTVLNVKDKEYKAHRALLIARSSVFASMFLHDTSEKQTGIVNISDCDPDTFEKFLEFLYCGKLEELEAQSALHLYETSDKYDVQELKTFSVETLMHGLTAENFCDVVIVADKYDDEKLLAGAQCFFNKNLSKVLEMPAWRHFMKNYDRLANELLIEMAKVKDEVSK